MATVFSARPWGFYRWPLDLIVEQAQKREMVDDTISRESIWTILKEHDLKPWQEKMWCSGDLNEEHIRRMEDVLDAYQRPYNEAFLVVCSDEKPVALFADATPRLPPRGPGEVMINDYEYLLAGSANVFCAVEPEMGQRINKATNCRDGLGFSSVRTELAAYCPAATKIVLVMDNISTHSCEIPAAYGRRPRQADIESL